MINSDYEIAVFPDSYYADAFKYSKNPLWQKAWKERIEPNLDFYDKYLQGLLCQK